MSLGFQGGSTARGGQSSTGKRAGVDASTHPSLVDGGPVDRPEDAAISCSCRWKMETRPPEFGDAARALGPATEVVLSRNELLLSARATPRSGGGQGATGTEFPRVSGGRSWSCWVAGLVEEGFSLSCISLMRAMSCAVVEMPSIVSRSTPAPDLI